MPLELALNAIDDDALIQLTRDLIQVDSINPPGAEQAVAELFADRARSLGLEAQIREVTPGRPNVLVRLPGSGAEATLLYLGHTDTVPPGEVPWTYPPLSGELADGRIWGRGAADMKSGLAAMLVAMAALKHANVTLPGDVVLAAVVGEEVDCAGSKHLLAERGMDNVGWLVISEPTALDFVVAHRGALWMEATTYGKTAHGSMPHLGVNAILGMMEFIHRVQGFEHPWQPHPLLAPPTVSVNTIDGGVKTNVVPDICRATIDMRTLPGQHHPEILAALQRLAEDMAAHQPGLRAEVRAVNDEPPVQTPIDHSLVLAAQRAAELTLGGQRPVRAATYYTDASVLQPPTGVPTLIVGPGEDGQAHQPNEWVSVDALKVAARLFTVLPSAVYGEI
ncbi:MAG TPA: M20 family metallopeptidase [Chloroflexota bacterium]|nr:M20 family metallopeptidase [Chloroflexota bacterium]